MRNVILASLLTVSAVMMNGLSAAEFSEPNIARDIYFSGKSRSGQVTIEGVQAAAELFPCAHCHGERAQGRKEGGVITPNITLYQLTQNFRRDLEVGSRRAAYDAGTFRRVLVDGISSDGRQLDTRMPRYHLSEQETDSLFEFLGEIDHIHAKGVSENSIYLGVRWPDNLELSIAMRDILSAYVENINAGHGIYRRKIHFIELTGTESLQPVFCILDFSLDYAANGNREDILISLFSKNSMTENQYALYQHPLGYAQISLELAEQNSWYLIPVTNGNFQDWIINQAQPKSRSGRWPVFQVDTRSIDLSAFFRLLNTHGRDERILLMNHIQSVDHPSIKNYSGDVYILQPPGLRNVSRAGRDELIKLLPSNATGSGLSDHLPAKLWTLTALSLVTKSLEMAGHDLTESVFEKALQQQVDFDNLFGPGLSYSATKRVGSLGVQAVKQN